MGSFGPVHWIIVVAVLAIYIVPVSRILRRTGFPGWLAVLALLPGINLLLLWVFAFVPWPRDNEELEAPPGDSQ